MGWGATNAGCDEESEIDGGNATGSTQADVEAAVSRFEASDREGGPPERLPRDSSARTLAGLLPERAHEATQAAVDAAIRSREQELGLWAPDDGPGADGLPLGSVPGRGPCRDYPVVRQPEDSSVPSHETG